MPDSRPVIEKILPDLTLNHEYAATLSAAGLDNFISLYTAKGDETVKSVPGREVIRLSLNHKGELRSFFLKRHMAARPRRMPVHLPGGLSSLPGKIGLFSGAASPGMEEFKQLLDFRQAGIATVTPIAGGERIMEDGHTASLVLTEDASPYISLEEAIRQRPFLFSGSRGRERKRILLRRIADTARAMHQAGKCHCDFNATHLLFHPEAIPEDIRPALFDLQRVRTRRLSRLRWWLKSMAEMGFTLEKPVFGHRDRLYLWLRYADRRWTRLGRSVGFHMILSKIRRIERHTERLLARRRKSLSPPQSLSGPSNENGSGS